LQLLGHSFDFLNFQFFEEEEVWSMRKTLLVLAVVLCLFSLSAGNAQAGVKWYTCTVVQAGPAGADGVNIMLTDDAGAFTRLWCVARNERQKEMLAVVLTAVASGLKVYASLDVALAKPTIVSLYLKQ
jgi:hypothetical protein